MVAMSCESLTRQALVLLEDAGLGASATACHLQAALDSLSPTSANDVAELEEALWLATPGASLIEIVRS